jgi:hypothetical protein
MYGLPLFVFPTINTANVAQTNTAVGNNIAVGSPFATQTLVQLQSNSAQIAQGK